jgi:hypothetical protein
VFKSFLRLSIGNVLGGITSIGALLLLPLFYSASQVGTYFLSLSLATFLSILISQGQDPVLISVKSDLQALHLVGSTIRKLLRNAVYVSLLAFSLKPILKTWVPFSFMEISLTLIVAIVYSSFGIFYYFTLRHENFKILSFRGPIQNLSIASLQIFGSFVHPSVSTLLFCEVTGRLIGFIPLFRFAVSQKFSKIDSSSHRFENFTETNGISKFMFPSNFIEATLMLILLGSINSRFGSDILGLLSWAIRFCVVPFSVLAMSLGQIYLTTFTKSFAHPSQALFSLFRRHACLVAAFAVSILILTSTIIPSFLNMYYPQRWDSVPELVRILAFFSASKFVWDAMSQFYNVLAMWKQLLYASISRMLSILIGLTYALFIDASFLYSTIVIFGALASTQLLLSIYIYHKVILYLKGT